MYESENIYDEIDKVNKHNKNKLRCLYKGYMSDIAILISLAIFVYYGYYISTNKIMDSKTTSKYLNATSNFPNNTISLILFTAEAIYLLFSAYSSFTHNVHKYSTGPQFLLYGIMIILSLFEIKKPENKNLGMSPLLVLPITIAMFFHNIPESYRNRKC